jgi:hypothetical protein
MGQTKHTLTIIQGRTFTQPLHLKDGSPRIFTFQEPYWLEEKDYLILTKTTSFLAIWAHTILAGATLYGITILARYIYYSNSSDKNIKIGDWELIALTIAFVLSGLLEILNVLLPNDKKKLLKEIGKHFEENQKFKGLI